MDIDGRWIIRTIAIIILVIALIIAILYGLYQYTDIFTSTGLNATEVIN